MKMIAFHFSSAEMVPLLLANMFSFNNFHIFMDGIRQTSQNKILCGFISCLYYLGVLWVHPCVFILLFSWIMSLFLQTCSIPCDRNPAACSAAPCSVSHWNCSGSDSNMSLSSWLVLQQTHSWWLNNKNNTLHTTHTTLFSFMSQVCKLRNASVESHVL